MQAECLRQFSVRASAGDFWNGEFRTNGEGLWAERPKIKNASGMPVFSPIGAFF